MKNIDVNVKNEFGRAPFSYAAGNGHEAVVRLLVESEGVDINARDNEGKTALTYATEEGHEAIVWLLNNRCDVPASCNGPRHRPG